MKIHVLCSKEELKKAEQIEEALSRAMKSLTDLGFKGEITIEATEETAPDTEIQSRTLNILEKIPPALLSHLADNGNFGLEHWLDKDFGEKTKKLLQDGVYFCTVLNLGEDYNNATPASMGACESVRFLATQVKIGVLEELISEAREFTAELLRLIEGNYSDPEYAISEKRIREIQRFFNRASIPFMKLALQQADKHKRS